MPSKTSIAIIGEGETERYYFDALRVAHRYPFKLLPGLPKHPCIDDMAKLASKYAGEGFDHVICLVDMDRLMADTKEQEKYLKARKKLRKKVMWIETQPCTEFWFLLHFMPSPKQFPYTTYDDLLPHLQQHMPDYEKTRKYFDHIHLYDYLTTTGSLDQAIQNAQALDTLRKRNPQNSFAYSHIYKVFQLLQRLQHP